jgi:hypothetical protein
VRFRAEEGSGDGRPGDEAELPGEPVEGQIAADEAIRGEIGHDRALDGVVEALGDREERNRCQKDRKGVLGCDELGEGDRREGEPSDHRPAAAEPVGEAAADERGGERSAGATARSRRPPAEYPGPRGDRGA